MATDISGEVEGKRVTVSNPLAVNLVDSVGMVDFSYDYVVETEPDTSTEVYTFYTGGAGGTQVAEITIVYSDSTKERFVSATKVTP